MQRSKLLVDCWKQISCSYCGCIYRRRVSCTKVGKAETQAEADAKATQMAIDYLESRVDIWPCPYCGHQQPEMVGSLRFRWHAFLLLASFAWIGPMLLDYHGLTPRWATIALLIALATVVIGLHWWLSTRFPNNYALRNKMQATFMVRNFMIWMDQSPNRKDGDWLYPDSIRPGKTFWILIAASVLSWTLFATSDVVRWTQGWPTNKSWHPEVVGPGDSAWLFLPTSIQCLKGHWTGHAQAMLEDVAAPGVFVPIHASTRVDEWGHTIQVDRNQSNSTRQLWIRIHLPDDAKWAGKNVRVHLAINTAFPVMDFNQQQFLVHQQAAQHQAELVLAPSHAGSTYWVLWYAGVLLPFVVLLATELYCVGCAYQLMHGGGSARVYRVNQPSPETPTDVDDVVPQPDAKDDNAFREERYPRRRTDGTTDEHG
jgi:hypothetical protein